MRLGLIFVIIACFVWGLIFVIPLFLDDFTSTELVLGRYIVYGLLSSVLFFRKGLSNIHVLDRKAWVKAAAFALLANIVYYFGVVAGVRFASPPLTVLLIGLTPILIAIYGNWHVREVSYKSLILPCIGIVSGLVLINITEIDWTFQTRTIPQYLIGLSGVTLSLLGWMWYGVHNARFLKRHPHVPATTWANAIGLWTLLWSLVLLIFFAFIIEKEVDLAKFARFSVANLRFFGGIFVLGIVCSWLGCYLWNRASLYLPVSLMGPFLIFESLFGLLFVYAVEWHLPTLLEAIGVLLMLGSTVLSVVLFKRQKYIN